MGLRVATNTSSLAAQRTLGQTNRAADESSNKLSSGERITKAADDAAGLAISERMKSHIRSGRQATRNANDGISMVQTAEGGLTQSSEVLTRMRELAIQAATDSVGDSERTMAAHEYEHLKAELERISQVTEFNGKKLLNGSGVMNDFQVGLGGSSQQDRISYKPQGFNAGASALGVSDVSIFSKEGAQASLAKIDSAFTSISGQRASLGSIQNRLQSSANNLEIYTENMSVSNGRIRDVDYALETANLARQRVAGSAGTAVLAQANVTGRDALKLVE